MKKKCRVYKKGGSYVHKQQGGEPSITQNSMSDPVYQQKTSDFMNWLKNSNQAALYEKRELAKAAFLDKAQDGKIINQGTRNVFEARPQETLGFFKGAYANMQEDAATFKSDLGQISKAFGNVLNQPDVFKYEGDFNPLLQQYQDDAYDNPTLTKFTNLGVEGTGRTRTLNYRADGTQKLKAPEAIGDNLGFDFSTPAAPGTNYSNYNPGDIDAQGFDMQWFNQNAGIKNPYKAQQGINIPGGLNPWADVPQQNYGVPPNPTGFEPTVLDDPQGTPFGDRELITLPENQPQVEPALADRDISETGSLELTKQNKLQTMMQNNPYGVYQGLNAGVNALSYLAEGRDRKKVEEQLRERVSNVHRFYNPQGADRGDYMTNVPGMGDFLKPDQHTLMGYGTKVARDGMQVNNEMELSEQEIQNLLAQGYELDYLD